MKADILKLLKERNTYVSGQELCEYFGVSRTAIWKAMQALEKEGYEIEAVRNKGYLLKSTADIYNQQELDAAIVTKYIGKPAYFHESIGSTNTEAKRLAEEGAANGTLVVADRQTAGKGRRGRSWDSPSGTNVYFTLLLKPEFEPDRASMLTLVMAMAVAGGIKRLCPQADTAIKWPNDVIIGGRKICGILTEMSVERDFIQHVVIGVGINVYHQEFDEQIAATAGCIEDMAGMRVSRCKLIGLILEEFEKYYEMFLEAGNLSALKDDYEKMLVNLGREIRVLDPKGEYEAVAKGIDDEGELLAQLPDGEIRKIYAGEVSVRGIYGYV